MIHDFTKKTLVRGLAACCGLAMMIGLAACGGDASATASSSASSSSATPSASASSTLAEMTGITASNEIGQKPAIKLPTVPYTVPDGGYQVLQQGNGETLQDGMRMCMHSVAVSAKTGAEIYSSWESAPDCSVSLEQSSLRNGLYDVLKNQKVGALIALGVNDTTATDDAQKSYIMATTIVSASHDLTRAEGQTVTDIPSNLPKVTLDGNGKPSIDMNGYQPDGQLVVQPLIKGSGATVSESGSVKVNYTGWLTDGTQFDSSWDRGEASEFALSQVVTGWKEGLAGQTVGSQVLVIVPPDKGYGSTAQGSIPANSTLVFVVDILATY
ncbi:FKBP-type peptidyl-prolyl cis-trans isomerase [Bifidobacterium vespertilionis]|uniref:FKBP-type peptidyl-prolyl cis-trans isomerase n=1 Tax=Bifidobacterium vespertilionis TaxID=2562524 RepID=UPI001BDC740C|nr:FKBP-type peptidyl-prolyl cis-trans isomerase [Bifidobacterium vespertilionis]MBT1179766.1 FKBP-type peptidyl-prolyl cis-trans isomerase [Bifidobacterium vespertilionis]